VFAGAEREIRHTGDRNEIVEQHLRQHDHADAAHERAQHRREIAIADLRHDESEHPRQHHHREGGALGNAHGMEQSAPRDRIDKQRRKQQQQGPRHRQPRACNGGGR
jgi:hypothetical protein